MSIIGFVLVALWVAFGAALVFSRGSLGATWQSFRSQPLPLQGVEAVLLLPWVLGYAVLRSSWALWLRAATVLALAWATIYMFFPWELR